MARTNAIELCREYLFADADDFRSKVSEADFDKIIRCRVMYLWMIEQPQAKDSTFVSEVCNRFKVSRPTAYSDLAVIKALLPELAKTAKEFHRWRYFEMILDTYETAKKKGDTRTMEKAASDYAKYAKIDVDKDEIDFADITPQPFVPTLDPRVLGIEPIPNLAERKKALLEKYTREVADVKDIDYEDIDLADLTNDISESPLKPVKDQL